MPPLEHAESGHVGPFQEQLGKAERRGLRGEHGSRHGAEHPPRDIGRCEELEQRARPYGTSGEGEREGAVREVRQAHGEHEFARHGVERTQPTGEREDEDPDYEAAGAVNPEEGFCEAHDGECSWV